VSNPNALPSYLVCLVNDVVPLEELDSAVDALAAKIAEASPTVVAMGKRTFYCGAAGQGLQAKLALNMIMANVLQAYSEGFVLAVKNGIKADMMFEILDNTAGKSALMSAKARSPT